MTKITDEQMRSMMTGTRTYTAVILKQGPRYDRPDRQAIVWEHGRRNFELRADGLLNIVGPVLDDSEVCGIGILDADLDRARELMDADPGVVAGVFDFELHPIRSFPGDQLARPGADRSPATSDGHAQSPSPDHPDDQAD